MRNSVVGVTNDLLSFHRHGNFSRFDRCFTKACRYFGLEITDQDRSYLRNLAFYYLRCTGFIDVSASDNSTRWSSSPGALIELKGRGFATIGDSVFSEKALEALKAFGRKTLQDNAHSGRMPDGVTFYPSIEIVDASYSDIMTECRPVGIPVIPNYQKSLFQVLPHVTSIERECLTSVRDEILFDPKTSLKLNFESAKWEPYRDTRPDGPGLFKRVYLYSAPDYYISTVSRRRPVETFRVIEREWFALLAAWKLNKKVRLKYSETSTELSILGETEIVRLPTLIERALRSGSMSNPVVGQNTRTYKGINPASFWELIAKFPFFEVTK